MFRQKSTKQNPEKSQVEIYFDGGCNPNPGKMSCCIVICQPGLPSKAHAIQNLGHGTNNVAEWAGMLWIAVWLKDNNIQSCKIYGDSMMVINQASGKWKAKHQNMVIMLGMFKQLSKGLNLSFEHVYRDYNLAGIYLEQIGC